MKNNIVIILLTLNLFLVGYLIYSNIITNGKIDDFEKYIGEAETTITDEIGGTETTITDEISNLQAEIDNVSTQVDSISSDVSDLLIWGLE